MPTSIIDGPQHVYGPMAGEASPPQSYPIIDPNSDAGPSFFYQGQAIPDPRLIYLKDSVQGGYGVVQGFYQTPRLKSIAQIPTLHVANNISAAANAVSGTAVTLASATLGITRNVPIRAFSGSHNGSAVTTAAIVLDFGFAFGNCTANSATITVSDSSLFWVGMPLVIGGVGNSGGTAPLLTVVATLASATTITVNASAVPLASNSTAPIGTGDIWGGMNASGQSLLPQSAMPFIAEGPALLLDPRQSVTRGVVITGVGGGAGGAFIVRGWDNYWQPMAETITATSGATATYGLKAFKAIASVTPQFSDAHNYTVGTSDVFGFGFLSKVWEDTLVYWAAALTTGAPTGWLAGDTATATATTGDVRGTIQTSAFGGGTGIGTNASNGSVSSLAMSGRRLEMVQFIGANAAIQASPANAVSMFGQTQYTV